MHQHHDVATSPEHSHCHLVSAQPLPRAHAGVSERGVALSRAVCGGNGGVPGTVLPPMLLTAAHGLPWTVTSGATTVHNTVPHARVADPPDTPPPIRVA
jgi:hypothetical protein